MQHSEQVWAQSENDQYKNNIWTCSSCLPSTIKSVVLVSSYEVGFIVCSKGDLVLRVLFRGGAIFMLVLYHSPKKQIYGPGHERATYTSWAMKELADIFPRLADDSLIASLWRR